jgi:hypothetical protein
MPGRRRVPSDSVTAVRLTGWALVLAGILGAAAAPAVDGAGGDATPALLAVLATPVGAGLLDRRDGWRRVCLGAAFLGSACAAFGLLMLAASAPYVLPVLQGPAGTGLSDARAAVVLVALGGGCVGLARLLTRPAVLRDFGLAVTG